MQKLGKNISSYQGEAIHVAAVLSETRQAALRAGWTFESVAVPGGIELHTWHLVPPEPRRRVYLSAGIHGDEPAGPLAARQLVQENVWPPGIELWLCPCLNPTGFPLNRRENAKG